MRVWVLATAVVFWWSSNSFGVVDKNPIIGNAKAPKGGTLVFGGLSYPKSLNAPVSGDSISNQLYGLIVESLCDVNPETGEYIPLIAERWDISKDKKVFTFHINKKAKFSDGTPVTTKDIKAYWDIVHNPKNLVGAIRASFKRFEKIEVVDKHAIKFYAKAPHFKNLEIACSVVATSHAFYLAEGKNFNKAFNSKVFGSGPYTLGEVDRGKKVVLKRRADYWGKDLPQNVGRFNFDKFVYRAIEDDTVRFEMFKKGDIDMFRFNVAKRWKTQTDGDKFKKNWIVARRVDNKAPQGFSGVILNTRRKPFDDLRVRKALAYTYHREKFIKDLFFNSYDRLYSYWPHSIWSNPSNKVIDYDLKKARKLLAEAGYTKTDNSGILIKDGKRFVAEYLYVGKASERHLTIWKEDLKKVGIDLKLTQITWPALVKKWEKYSFDMAGVAWTAGLNPDPYEMWHSEFQNQASGNNLSGFVDERLDSLITKIGPMFDRQQRAKVFHEMDNLLFENHPYILGWSLSYIRVGYWNRLGFIPQVAPLYSGVWEVWQYAWLDPTKDKALKDAMKAEKALTPTPNIKGPHS